MPKVTKRKRLIALFERWKSFEEENIQVNKGELFIPNTIYEYHLRRTKAQELEWRQPEEENEDEEDAKEEEMGEQDKAGQWEELLENELLNEEEEEEGDKEERFWNPEHGQDAENVWLPLLQEHSYQESEGERIRKLEEELEAILWVLRSKRYLQTRKRIKPVVPIASWFEQEKLQSDRAFRTTFRMGKPAFFHLVSRICTHPVFSNQSYY